MKKIVYGAFICYLLCSFFKDNCLAEDSQDNRLAQDSKGYILVDGRWVKDFSEAYLRELRSPESQFKYWTQEMRAYLPEALRPSFLAAAETIRTYTNSSPGKGNAIFGQMGEVTKSQITVNFVGALTPNLVCQQGWNIRICYGSGGTLFCEVMRRTFRADEYYRDLDKSLDDLNLGFSPKEPRGCLISDNLKII